MLSERVELNMRKARLLSEPGREDLYRAVLLGAVYAYNSVSGENEA